MTWHAAEDGAALAALLQRLGLLPGARGDTPAAEAPVQPASAEGSTSAPAVAGEPTPAVRTSTVASGVAWAVAGLAAGSLLTVVALRVRRRPNPASPAHDRVDSSAPTRPRVAGQTVHSIMGAREGRGVDVLEQ